jgi:hypothetical protein
MVRMMPPGPGSAALHSRMLPLPSVPTLANASCTPCYDYYPW